MNARRVCFEFKEDKATAAAAVLLKKEPLRRMPYLRLMKLLYIAERESLKRRGRPIVGDDYFNMKHGPVLSTVLNLIRSEEEDLGEADLWRSHVRKDGFDVVLAKDPGADALSESEVEILEAVSDRHRHLDQWKIRDLTHEFPEWRDPGESCSKISPETLLRAVGKTEEEIAEIAAEAEESGRIDALLRGEIPA